MAIPLQKVLISDEVDPKCVEILQNAGIEVVKNTKLSKEQLIEEIQNYDGLIVRSATKVTADVIAAASRLKIIGRAGTGVDNIDCDAATRKGIIVMNTPGGNTLSAAEHTCAMMCSLTRDIPQANQSMREGRWDRKKYMGTELNGKTLAIIGLGRIGKEVALRMQSFGMKTIGFDPIIGGDVSATFGVDWLPLEQIWTQADFITVHTPLLPQTTNLINDAVFAVCKPGVRIINCARGGIVDEAALLRALQSGQCGGAAFDVFVKEPPTDLALIQHPKVVATPHLGASTTEAQSRVAQEIAEQFVDVKLGRKLFGAINAQALVNALSPACGPWVQLGKGLGELASRLVTSGTQQEIGVICHGESLKSAGSYLGAAVLAGYLKQTGGDLNLVNAPALAKEMGVKVLTSHETNGNDGSAAVVSITMTTRAGDKIQLTGSVAGGVPVLVEVSGSTFNYPPTFSRSLVLFKALKKPDLIPSVINNLTLEGLDVQSVTLSAEKDSSVWGVVNLDKPVSNGLEALRKQVSFCSSLVIA